MSGDKIPYKIFHRDEIKEITDDGIIVNYKDEDWKIPYGKYVNAEMIRNAETVKVMKYGHKWIVAYVNGNDKENVSKDNAEKEINNAEKENEEIKIHDFLKQYMEFKEIALNEYGITDPMQIIHLFISYIEVRK